MIALMLASHYPMFVAWGPELTFLYNADYAPILGRKHPSGLGRPFADVWSEIWDDVGPLAAKALAGEATFHENLHLVMERNGYPEDTWYSFSYSPVRNDLGQVEGMFCACMETTGQVLADKRQTFRLSLEKELVRRRDPVEMMEVATALLGQHLGAAQVGFAEVEEDGEHIIVTRHWNDGRVRPVTGRWRMDDFGPESIRQLKAGQSVPIPDVSVDDRTRHPDVLAAYEAIGARAVFDVPFVRDNHMRAMLFIHDPEPRIWALEEIALVEETCSRLWSAVERARAEAELRASLELNQRILASSADCIKVLDSEARLEFMSEGGMCVMEVEDFGTIKGACWPDFWTGEGHDKALAAVAEAKRGGTGRFQAFGTTMKGSPRWWDVIVTPISGEDGRPEKLLSISRDVTATKEAEAALRDSEEQLRLATEAAEVGLWDLDVTTGTLFWPARVKAMFGVSAETSVSMADYYAGLHPDDAELTAASFAAAVDPDKRALYDVEYRTIGKEDGVIRWVAAKGRAQFDADGRCVRVIGTALDITRRKGIEEQLRELNATLETRVAERTAERDRTWNNSRDLLVVVDTRGTFRAVNPAWTAILGWTVDELVGHSHLQFIHPDDHPGSETALGTASKTDLPIYSNRYCHKDGTFRWISWVAAPEDDLIYASGRDITDERTREGELKVAQEALRQSQKMEAMGQLTGGVAHDFNNLLTPIVGALDMLDRQGLGGEREHRLIAGAIKSAERATTLVQRLLAFARRQPLQPKPIDIGKLVSGMTELISSTAGPQIRIAVDVATDLPPARADFNQLEMALLNLGVNARDAMPDGGTLRISAAAETVPYDHRSGAEPGNYVRLSVADTGFGMDETTLRRAVEPFFSTKGIGKGTGLGLSMVHGLAQQLGGAMTIQSRRGVGTNIEMWLPVAPASVDTTDPSTDASATDMRAGVALLVEDEELVRISTADMLGGLGYSVVEATSAEEALGRLRQGLRPNILITDHLMPGMNGTDLARMVRSEHPQIKLLIVSGYAEQDGVAPDLPRLTKPFRKNELAASLAAL